LEDPDEIRRELIRLTHELMDDLERDGRPVIRVTVKVRFTPFFTQQRSVKMAEPTLEVAAIDEGHSRHSADSRWIERCGSSACGESSPHRSPILIFKGRERSVPTRWLMAGDGQAQ